MQGMRHTDTLEWRLTGTHALSPAPRACRIWSVCWSAVVAFLHLMKMVLLPPASGLCPGLASSALCEVSLLFYGAEPCATGQLESSFVLIWTWSAFLCSDNSESWLSVPLIFSAIRLRTLWQLHSLLSFKKKCMGGKYGSERLELSLGEEKLCFSNRS